MQKIFSQQMCFLKMKQKIICNFALILTFSFVSLNILSNNVSAVYTPTLSASIDQSELTVNGNQIINSTSKSTNITLNLKVNTNNKTGYTTTISSETENTALINTNTGGTDKISSISDITSLNGFSANTWGYKLSNDVNYNPIPALSSPANLIQTTAKTNGDEVNNIDLGIKLGNNLESGNYKNKLISSVVTNYYEEKAILVSGMELHKRLKTPIGCLNEYFTKESGHKTRFMLRYDDFSSYSKHPEDDSIVQYIEKVLTGQITSDCLRFGEFSQWPFLAPTSIKSLKRSSTPPTQHDNTISMEDTTSDIPITYWIDTTSKTLYYYSSANKIYLNEDSASLFSPFMFSNELDLSGFDTSLVVDMSSMFAETLIGIDSLDLSTFNTKNVKNMESMFASLSFYNVNGHTQNINLSSFDTRNLENMNFMFADLAGLRVIDLTSFYTPSLKQMKGTFTHCFSLKTLKIPNIITEKVVDMSRLFYGVKPDPINLSRFDTSKVEDFSYLFYNSTIGEDSQMPAWDTSSARNMQSMFASSGFSVLDISNFDTSNVTNMSGMFDGMLILKELRIGSKFNTTNVTNMERMFYDLPKMTELDLSSANFNTSKVENFDLIFALDNAYTTSKLQKIYVKQDFDITEAKKYAPTTEQPNVNKDLFHNQKALRGGNGSFKSNPSEADLTWLRIDRPGTPGYFTQK